eukprot:TRINITY_DN8094_c0_g1_i1.p1 TRINITY_DN8094_c0_g1~~TRINITY_DN8094_c0_g1_i1.p1  ORF type:complete len:216 (-),score=70.79 TRINITY_DN8094_c0_g1_i1:150-719(-)
MQQLLHLDQSTWVAILGCSFGTFLLGKYVFPNSQPILGKKQDLPEKEEDEEEEGEDDSEDDYEEGEEDDDEDGEPCKMVLVVRMDLKMGTGKIAAQVGHATLGAYRRGIKKCPAVMRKWGSSQAKVVVKVQTEEELLSIEKAAKEAGLNYYMVQDAGRTQIASGSRTVLAVGPDVLHKVDGVTSKLKLL